VRGRSAQAAGARVDLDGRTLSVAGVTAVARSGTKVAVSATARKRLEASWRRASRVAARGMPVYGRTTGVGAKLAEPVAGDDAPRHSLALLRSHAGGFGPVLSPAEARALLVVRANQLLAGGAGIHVSVLDAILAALKSGATPLVHSLGGIGTGDLTALAEVGLALAGEGAWHEGRRAGDQVSFGPGDGLALMSSNACTLGRAALLASDASRMLSSVDAVVAFSVLACGGGLAAFDPRVHASRPFNGPSRSARRVREMLGDSYGAGERLQDPFGIRCAPQLNGAAQDSLDRLIEVLEADFNSAMENPLIARDENAGTPGGRRTDEVALANGNFLTTELAGVLDQLRSTLAGVGLGSLARLGLLCDPSMTGVTKYLTDGTPGASGVMIFEHTAQAAMDRLRLAATSTSCWPVTVSVGIEQLASHAPLGVEQLGAAIEALSVVIGVELVAAVRALGLRGVIPDTPMGLSSLRRARAVLSRDLADRPLGPDVMAAAFLVLDGLIESSLFVKTRFESPSGSL